MRDTLLSTSAPRRRSISNFSCTCGTRRRPGQDQGLYSPSDSLTRTITQIQKLPFDWLLHFHYPISWRFSSLSNGSSMSHVWWIRTQILGSLDPTTCTLPTELTGPTWAMWIKCLTQGHNTLPRMRLEPGTLRSQVCGYSYWANMSHCVLFNSHKLCHVIQSDLILQMDCIRIINYKPCSWR